MQVSGRKSTIRQAGRAGAWDGGGWQGVQGVVVGGGGKRIALWPPSGGHSWGGGKGCWGEGLFLPY